MSEPHSSAPRPAFRVSVIGHRPNRLPKDPCELGALQERISAVLAATKQAVADIQADAAGASPSGSPAMLAISSLAEGADRMFAEEAMRLDYSLYCPMPFAQSVFEEDFAPDAALEPESVDRFRALLDQARRGAGLEIFELAGERTSDETMAAAYEAAGRAVLNHSDLMLAVWDGGQAAGVGGTVNTLFEAVSSHRPLLWIDAVAPFGWTVVRSESDLSANAGRPSPANVPSADQDEDDRKIAAAVSQIVREKMAPPARLTATA